MIDRAIKKVEKAILILEASDEYVTNLGMKNQIAYTIKHLNEAKDELDALDSNTRSPVTRG